MTDLRKQKFLRLPQILQLIPIGKLILWEEVKRDEFPKQIKLEPKTSVWKVLDIQAYMKSIDNFLQHLILQRL